MYLFSSYNDHIDEFKFSGLDYWTFIFLDFLTL